MEHRRPDVKRNSRHFAEWVDCHPRTGWYIAVWAALVSLNAVLGFLDFILHALA